MDVLYVFVLLAFYLVLDLFVRNSDVLVSRSVAAPTCNVFACWHAYEARLSDRSAVLLPGVTHCEHVLAQTRHSHAFPGHKPDIPSDCDPRL